MMIDALNYDVEVASVAHICHNHDTPVWLHTAESTFTVSP
jgi:nucleoside phosphorylase